MAKQNMSLPELVAELESQKVAKRDFVVPTSGVKMEVLTKDLPNTDDAVEQANRILRIPMIVVPNVSGGSFEPNEVFHQHMAEKLGIPPKYYRRMQAEAPELLSKNVNEWLEREKRGKSLIRTFEYESMGMRIARGMLSDRYGIMDNYDILFAALTAIKESGVEVEIKECNITDKRLYVHIVAPNVEVQSEEALKSYLRDKSVSVGHGIISGLVITNSEVGFGSYEIRPRAFIKVCSNGLIVKDDRFRKVHLGGKMNEGQINWSERTQQKNLDLIMSQTGDAIKQFLSEDYLSGIVRKLEDASKVELENPVDALQNAVKEVAKQVSLSEENKKNIMSFFVKDGDTNSRSAKHGCR
jgi:hypothetical protein